MGLIYGLRLRDSKEYRYIGQTQIGAEKRFAAHLRSSRLTKINLPVHKWIKKYGESSVCMDVLEIVDGPIEFLDEREIYWIAQFDKERLLNIANGGRGSATQSLSAREKRVKSSSGPLHYNYGKHHSEETRQKLCIARRNRPPFSEETKAKMSASFIANGKNPQLKLTSQQVLEIRAKSQDGITGIELAKQYGVSGANISSIVRRKTWNHI